jgi:hypothetical protein
LYEKAKAVRWARREKAMDNTIDFESREALMSLRGIREVVFIAAIRPGYFL